MVTAVVLFSLIVKLITLCVALFRPTVLFKIDGPEITTAALNAASEIPCTFAPIVITNLLFGLAVPLEKITFPELSAPLPGIALLD